MLIQFQIKLPGKPINTVEIVQRKIVSTYVENVNSLIDDDGLSQAKREKTLSIARGLTLQTIESLDELKNQDVSNKGKSEIIRFLYDFGLIGSTKDDGLECTKDWNLDLRRVNLENVNLAKKNSQCINLRGASLQNAKFEETILIGADLSYATLKGADFTNANLSEVNLTGADLTGADLTGALIDEKLKDILTEDQKRSACNSNSICNLNSIDNSEKCKKWLECKCKQNKKICNLYYQRRDQ